MAISISCDKQYTDVIHIHVTGKWTWDEFYEAMDVAHQHMDLSDHEAFNFILDMRDRNQLPDYILTNMRQVITHHHTKSKTLIVLGAKRPIQALFKVMVMTVPEAMNHIHLVDTMEDAYNVVLDEHLPTIGSD